MKPARSLLLPPSRRRRHRANRLRLHPERKSRSEKMVVQAKMLHGAMTQLMLARKAFAEKNAEIADLKEKANRARADLGNVRKRTMKDKDDLRKFAAQPLLEALLPAFDSFDLALAAVDVSHNTKALAEGVDAIRQQIVSALADQGVERVNPLGEPFDPEHHEALGVEKTKKHPENSVIQVLQPGYVLKGRLVRPARVRIAQKP